MKKLTFLVDMDGVMVDLLPAWLFEYRYNGGEHVKPESVTEYAFAEYINNRDLFFSSLEPALKWAPAIPGAINGVRALRDAGHEVYFLTYAATWAAPNAHRAKLDWLRHSFEESQDPWCIFTEHKHMVRGDVLVEDSLDNVKMWHRKNPSKKVFVVDQPYNRKFHPYPHGGWKELTDWVFSIDDATTERVMLHRHGDEVAIND